jgi:hypothetical protein
VCVFPAPLSGADLNTSRASRDVFQVQVLRSGISRHFNWRLCRQPYARDAAQTYVSIRELFYKDRDN